MLQVSPLADCDVTKEACKCDFDDFVIVGKIWKLIGYDKIPPPTHTYAHLDIHRMRYPITEAFKETSPEIRLCP